MSLRLIGPEAFIEVKKSVFFPSKAITSPEHLMGRVAHLEKIRRAFSNDGKQVFVFGERGVGKTSLAKTAAYLHQSSDNEPVLVACAPNNTFVEIIRDVALACLPAEESMRKTSESQHKDLGIKGLSSKSIKTVESGEIPKIDSVNHAIVLLKFISQMHSDEPVVIIDEFDRLESEHERGIFADFLKQVSDQDLNIRFIFCGISEDIEGLIGEHFSAGRYMCPVELGPLPADALWKIFESAEAEFGVSIDKEIKIRASIIADGYPYFMHLIGDSLLWLMYNSDPKVDNPTADMFDEAVSSAIEEAEPMLKKHYDDATQKYEKRDYHEVLWATAAARVFPKKWKDIYDEYYVELVKPHARDTRLSSDAFYKRILALTKESHGEILRTNENGWYQFRENVVRSYVRLRASEAGIDLGADLPGRISASLK